MGSRFGSCLAGACGLFLATSAQAGAGLRSSGDTLYSSRVSFITATQQWDGDSVLRDSRCRSQYTSYGHGLEHGYSYYNTFYGQLSLANTQCGNESNAGLSDLRVGIRSRLNVYRDDGAWELEATLPVSHADPGERRIGCGEFGLAANVHKRLDVTPLLDVDGSLGVQLWDAPLAHQLRASAGVTRKFLRRWSWSGGLQGALPLNDGTGDPGSLLSDCGTEGKVVRALAHLSYRRTDFLRLDCGVTEALWGEDVSRARGFSCGFSYLWKD